MMQTEEQMLLEEMKTRWYHRRCQCSSCEDIRWLIDYIEKEREEDVRNH